jgi:hypothetical protein
MAGAVLGLFAAINLGPGNPLGRPELSVTPPPVRYTGVMLRAVMTDPHDDCPGPNYAGQVLFGVDLRGRDVHVAEVTNTTLRFVDFRGAKFHGGRFSGAALNPDCDCPEGFNPMEHGATPEEQPLP